MADIQIFGNKIHHVAISKITIIDTVTDDEILTTYYIYNYSNDPINIEKGF